MIDKFFFNGTHDGMAYHAEVTRYNRDGHNCYDVDVKCFNNKTGNCSISFSRIVWLNRTPKQAVREAFNIARREGCL